MVSWVSACPPNVACCLHHFQKAELGFTIFALVLDDAPELVFARSTDAVQRRFNHAEVKWISLAASADGRLWLLQLTSVRIGGTEVLSCATCGRSGDDACTAVVDSGSVFMRGPPGSIQELREIIQETGDCVNSSMMPDIEFSFFSSAGPVTLAVSHQEYLDHAAFNDERCRFTFEEYYQRGGAGVWILGQPLLRKLVTIFDVSGRRMGFAERVSQVSMSVDHSGVSDEWQG